MPRAVFASKSCRIQPSHWICSKALTRASEYFPEDINHQKVNIFYIAQGGKPRQTHERRELFSVDLLKEARNANLAVHTGCSPCWLQEYFYTCIVYFYIGHSSFFLILCVFIWKRWTRHNYLSVYTLLLCPHSCFQLTIGWAKWMQVRLSNDFLFLWSAPINNRGKWKVKNACH